MVAAHDLPLTAGNSTANPSRTQVDEEGHAHPAAENGPEHAQPRTPEARWYDIVEQVREALREPARC